MIYKLLNLLADSLELIISDLIVGKRSRGRKSNAYKRLASSTRRSRKQPTSHLVLNERAILRLSGKLFNNLPRDVAISVLNDINQYAK